MSTTQATNTNAYTLRRQGLAYSEIAARLGLRTWQTARDAARLEAARRGEHRTILNVGPAATPAALRRFGIEVEFNHRLSNNYQGAAARAARVRIANTVHASGIECHEAGYTHTVTPHWKMVYDCTVTGGELVSPIMSGDAASLEEVRRVLNIVKADGGTTGRRVGMHVHHDVTDFNRDDMVRLVRNLRDVEEALMAYVPSHRYDGTNTYGANRINGYEWHTLETNAAAGVLARGTGGRQGGCGVTRYKSINFNSVLTYGSVEIRLLGHTLNTVKVRAWIEVGQAIFRATKAGYEFGGRVTPEEMAEALVANGGLSRSAARTYVAGVEARRPALAA